MAGKITKQWALQRFEKVIDNLDVETPIYEVQSIPMNDLHGIQWAISQVPHNTALWQHTDAWHTVAYYIDRGQGYRFNREILDLISSGVDTESKFDRAWDSYNNFSRMGYFPRSRSSKTSSSRMSQKSYIVADLSRGCNPRSKIKGRFTKNMIHRTHLISSQITGIESHKGLLIDFDGWLNAKPLNDFERSVLQYTKTHDIIWVANVWHSNKGLHFQYTMYNPDWTIYKRQEWIDDRWTYLWWIDDGQDSLTR